MSTEFWVGCIRVKFEDTNRFEGGEIMSEVNNSTQVEMVLLLKFEEEVLVVSYS